MIVNGVEISSPGRSEVVLQSMNGSGWSPKVNGKHNKHVQHVSFKGKGELLLEGNRVAKIFQLNIPRYREILPDLESWQAHKIASWHNIKGHSIQWLCIVCIDRRGIMAEVTTVLAAAGITVCSCVAEIDGGRGNVCHAVPHRRKVGKFGQCLLKSRSNAGCFGVVNWLQLAKLYGRPWRS